MDDLRLNIGCGSDVRPGYVNIDAFADGATVRMDAGRLGFSADTVDEIFSSHVLEHLSRHDVLPVLREWLRVLKPAGKVRILVPDLPWCMEQWLRLPESARWDWALDTIYGLQDHPGEFHKTGFSRERLQDLLERAGFTCIDVSTRFDHGMQSLLAVANGGEHIPASTPASRPSRWIRKHLVFLFYRLAAYASSGP